MTPDLQRIVEALKACRERYELTYFPPDGTWCVFDLQEGYPIVTGTEERCLAAYDARCAEAMVRTIREPDLDVLQAGRDAARRVRLTGLTGMTIDAQVRAQCAREAAAQRAMCDAILGEIQP